MSGLCSKVLSSLPFVPQIVLYSGERFYFLLQDGIILVSLSLLLGQRFMEEVCLLLIWHTVLSGLGMV